MCNCHITFKFCNCCGTYINAIFMDHFLMQMLWKFSSGNRCESFLCRCWANFQNVIAHQQCWACVIFLMTRHESLRHAVLLMRHGSPQCFFYIFLCVIDISRHPSLILQLLKLVSTLVRPHTGSQTLPSRPSGHLPPILLAVKLSPLCPVVILTPPHPAVIFHPSC